jgi:hypothetical protein
MADRGRDIFRGAVESMVEGGSLRRAFVNQLLEAGHTYKMILKEAVNLGILDQDQYDDIAGTTMRNITDAAEILYLIRTNRIRSYAQGIDILVRNNTLTEDIVNELREDGSSNEQILEDLAAMQEVARARALRRRFAAGGGRTRRNSRKRRG